MVTHLEDRKLLGLDLGPVTLVIKKDRLRWFGHVEHRDDTDWSEDLQRWRLMELDGDVQEDMVRTRWDGVREDVNRFGLSWDDAQDK